MPYSERACGNMHRVAGLAMRGLMFFGAAVTATQGRAEVLDFERLRLLIEIRQVHAIETLLPLLPSSYRAGYTLVFESRSLQQASFESPRAIVFGNDATFILTFNGDSSQRGHDVLETMQFDARDKAFVFREVTFDDHGTARYSSPNPPGCLACHGAPARPIWDSWPTWPGVYGEHYGAPPRTAEQAHLVRFLQGAASHPRYGTLEGLARLADPATFHPSVKQDYEGRHAEPPNAVLSELLSAMNARLIARQVAAAEDFRTFGPALLATLKSGCDFEDALPDALLAHWLGPRQDFARHSRQANTLAAAAKAAREEPPRSPATVDVSNTLEDFRFLAEAALGLSTERWSMALESGSSDYSGRASMPDTLTRLLLPVVAREDPQLLEIFTASTTSDNRRYCVALQRRSRQALASNPVDSDTVPRNPGKRSAAAAVSQPAWMSACTRCHDLAGLAPPIHFDRPDSLATELRQAGYEHGMLLDEIRFRISVRAGARRMPPDSPLEDGQARALLDYLQKTVEGIGTSSSP